MTNLQKLVNKYLRYVRFHGELIVKVENEIVIDSANSHLAYPLASLTKQFTAAAIYNLVSSGQLHLNTTLYDIYKKSSKIDQVTIGELVTMKSGIVDYLNDEEYKKKLRSMVLNGNDSFKTKLIKDLFYREPLFHHGEKMKYSNSDYFFLGDIVEKISGMNFEEYLEKNILKPLDLQNVFFGNDENNLSKVYNKDSIIPHEMAYSSCGLFSSMEDFAKWVERYIAPNIDRIISYDEEYSFGLNICKDKQYIYHSGSTIDEEIFFIYDYVHHIYVHVFCDDARFIDIYTMAHRVYETVRDSIAV